MLFLAYDIELLLEPEMLVKVQQGCHKEVGFVISVLALVRFFCKKRILLVCLPTLNVYFKQAHNLHKLNELVFLNKRSLL